MFRDYRSYLAPGERGTMLILAADRKQSRVIFRYISALLKQVPMLALLVENERAESFDLTDRITIEVGTASYRTTRGYTFVAVLCDELAFWRSDDSANPDDEIINAIRPGMLTIPTAMLLCASSPYARRGALWDAHQTYFGKDDPEVQVWQAATTAMNPTVPQASSTRSWKRIRMMRARNIWRSFVLTLRHSSRSRRCVLVLIPAYSSGRMIAGTPTLPSLI